MPGSFVTRRLLRSFQPKALYSSLTPWWQELISRKATVSYDLVPACPALQCPEDRHAGVIAKVCPLLRQTSWSCTCSTQTKSIRHSFLKQGFPIPEENANLTGVVFLYTLAVKLQASRLANQACQILTMGWLEQVIPGLPWNGQPREIAMVV